MKNLKRIAAAIAALIVVIPCAATPVFANSGPAWEYGVTGTGVTVRNEDSVLAVESERLIFDIKDFPPLYPAEPVEYKSTVTAEYRFKNTSENTVHTSMAFPLGNVPDYLNSCCPPPGIQTAQDVIAPVITVDGVEVETQIRHTYGNYLYYDGFDEGVPKILDDWYKDDFFKPDTPVKAYTVKVDRDNYSDIVATCNVTADESKARYLCGNGYGNRMNFYYYETSFTFEDLVECGQYVFYVLGDESAISFDWKVQEEFSRFGKVGRRDVDLPVEVKEITDNAGQLKYPTLKDLILSGRVAGSAVSEMDYYNGIAQEYLRTSEGDAYGGDLRSLPKTDAAFCVWYTYEVEAQPNASFVNTVTAPLYPNIHTEYSPYVYEYEYYLSPAKEWASFGKLTIEINANGYFLFHSLPVDISDGGFSTSDGTYVATFDSLPDEELTFRLCSEENPLYNHGGGTSVALYVVFIIIALIILVPSLAGFIVAMVYLGKNRKKGN